MLPVVNLVKFRQDIVEAAGAGRLDRSILAGGSSGLNCSRTYMSVLTGEIHVSVEYAVSLPFPQFTNLKAKFREEMRVKAWTGYLKRDGNSDGEEIVYITDTALVYHEDYQCTYLQLSVRFVPYSGLSGIRNEDGGRYYQMRKMQYTEMLSAGSLYYKYRRKVPQFIKLQWTQKNHTCSKKV